MLTKRALGEKAERYACHYLTKQGLTLIDKNFTAKGGEIDLIMKDNHYMVFVEVRMKKAGSMLSPIESITPAKQARCRHAATIYLQKAGLFDKIDCRFDVIAIEKHSDNVKLTWIKNAF